MPLSPRRAPNSKPSLSFYDAYLAVIYGLVATKGLERWVELNQRWVEQKPHPDWHSLAAFFFVFLAIFVVGLHFWLTCASVESRSASFYSSFVGEKWAELFLLVDALVATGFAGIILAIFSAIAEHLKALLVWFIVAAVVSLAYDGYSRVLIVFCERRRRSSKDETVTEYKAAVHRWFIQDGIFFAGTVLVFLLATRTSGSYYISPIALLVVSTIVLVLDVKFLAP